MIFFQARIDALNEEKAQAKAKVEEIKYRWRSTLQPKATDNNQKLEGIRHDLGLNHVLYTNACERLNPKLKRVYTNACDAKESTPMHAP